LKNNRDFKETFYIFVDLEKNKKYFELYFCIIDYTLSEYD